MADFCTKCAFEMWGNELPPDIDIQKIADGMTPGHYTAVLCEGCEMIAIAKDDDGSVLIGVLDQEAVNSKIEEPNSAEAGNPVKWIKYEVWEGAYAGLHNDK